VSFYWTHVHSLRSVQGPARLYWTCLHCGGVWPATQRNYSHGRGCPFPHYLETNTGLPRRLLVALASVLASNRSWIDQRELDEV
jgi:hypothetical protein